MRFFICPTCQKEIPEDVELVHKHIRDKHFERILDQYTISVLNTSSNWIEKSD
jgi:hypothetical protein